MASHAVGRDQIGAGAVLCPQGRPVIGHLKDDCGLRRNWLKGSEGDVLHPVLCAAGYSLRGLPLETNKSGAESAMAR
jgi:hypothetical protein